jgi:S1 RNA binding domain protein
VSETPNDATDAATDDLPETQSEDLVDEVESADAEVESADADADAEVDAEVEADEVDADEADAGDLEPLPIPDELRVGAIVDGVVAKLVDFGAFVDIPTERGTATGLVHVSEVAPGFVENIYAEVGEGDAARVKVLSIGDDGKIGLSIKQAREDWAELAELDKPVRSKIDKDFDRKLRKFMHGSQSIQGEARRQKRRKLGS